MGTMLVIDGNNLAHRAAHAMRDLSYNGQKTGVIYGTLESTHHLLSEFLPSRIVFVWDTGHAPRRKKLHPGYKAGRKSTQEKIDSRRCVQGQIDILRTQVLPCFPFLHVSQPHAEADDLIAAVCGLACPERNIVVVTGDKDMLQLVRSNVSIFVPQRHVVVTRDNFSEIMGYPWKEYLPARAILGDPSDGIEGVKGVGKGSVEKILSHAGSILRYINDPSMVLVGEPRAEARARMLRESANREIMSRNIELMNLFHPERDVDVRLAQEAALAPIPPLRREAAATVLSHYGLHQAVVRLTTWERLSPAA